MSLKCVIGMFNTTDNIMHSTPLPGMCFKPLVVMHLDFTPLDHQHTREHSKTQLCLRDGKVHVRNKLQTTQRTMEY